MLRNKYPIQAVLRGYNGVATLRSHMEATAFSALHKYREINYDIANDIVTISSWSETAANPIATKLLGGINHGDIVAIFKSEIYKRLPVRGSAVIDVGAGIADSSIYFVYHGAAKVIGIEPFPKVYELGKKNVILNGLSNEITLILAGCSAEAGSLNVDPDAETQISTYLSGFSDGIKVPLLTLDNILSYNNTCSDVVLKMDCEGWEYDVILTASRDTLRRFSHMQIEYHYGYENLKEKLTDAGFAVSTTRPTYDPLLGNPYRRPKVGHFGSKKLFIGYLHAKRV